MNKITNCFPRISLNIQDIKKQFQTDLNESLYLMSCTNF